MSGMRYLVKISFIGTVFLLVAHLLFSCSSVKSISIDTYNPAAITFPPEVKTVMIVNNSAQQPDGIGHQYGQLTIPLSKLSSAFTDMISDSVLYVSSDSTAYYFCKSLGKGIVESPVFYDVRLCEDTLRRDSVFYSSRPFKADDVAALCDDYGVDAIISLDRLIFQTAFYEMGVKDFYDESYIKTSVSGELRAFWPGQSEVYTFPFSDSLKWSSDENSSFDYPFVKLTADDIRLTMLYLSELMGYNMHVNFIPFWINDKRWYYNSISSEWRRGTVFAAAEKWPEAASVWEPLLAKTSKWERRAQLSSNLALCNEMTGDFEKAASYAEKSYHLYKEHAGEDSANTKLQSQYMEVLKKRIETDKTLSKQLRENQN